MASHVPRTCSDRQRVRFVLIRAINHSLSKLSYRSAPCLPDNTCEVDRTRDRGLTRAHVRTMSCLVFSGGFFSVHCSSRACSLLFPCGFLTSCGPLSFQIPSGILLHMRKSKIKLVVLCFESKNVHSFNSFRTTCSGPPKHPARIPVRIPPRIPKDPQGPRKDPTTTHNMFSGGAQLQRALLQSSTCFLQVGLQSNKPTPKSQNMPAILGGRSRPDVET